MSFNLYIVCVFDKKGIYMDQRNGLKRMSIYVILVMLFTMILEYAYANIVTRYWGYWFLYSEEIGIGQKIVSWFFVFLLFFLLDIKSNTISNCILKFLYFITFIPSCVILEYVSVDVEYKCIFFLYWTILFVINRLFPYLRVEILAGRKGWILSGISVLIFCFLIIAIWLYYAQARMNLDLDDIYIARVEARNYDMPKIVSYLYLFAKALIPISVSVNLYKQKWVTSLILTLVGFICYFIEGSKTAVFSLLFVYCFWLALKMVDVEKIWGWIAFAFNGVSIAAVLVLKLFGGIRISSYLFQRSFFLPAIININYYEFFKNSEKDFFCQSIVGKLTGIPSHYEVEIPRLIGKYAFGDIAANANTGLVGDAYANLGVLGVIIMPCLFILLLRIIDLCIKGMPLQVYLSLSVILAFNFLSISFFTTLLSNGVVVILIYLLCTKRDETRMLPVHYKLKLKI